MLSGLKQFFEKNLSKQNESKKMSDELAIACLLAEVIFADNEFDQQEWQTLLGRLKRSLDLSDEALNELADSAKEQVQQASDLYQFTSVVKALAYEKRIDLLQGLWHVAYADGKIDPHEEHIIRRISELIGLTHRDFIQAKLSQAKD
ncbi:TerB family tellurite resistance protein [Catenovulum adriaticum]|uniref:TerB family tellurite resistance protein n=1 Tax=Catenovulum adriaticum TaxID=2984846 RepID=A0ABY7ARP5_9ALTE|nr:TerB family tellurite resistance protein [Catenovulum sp. TS8]WAJ71341.1 TerB family tellurite resistance protein [Catenovulum sp. TS8]